MAAMGGSAPSGILDECRLLTGDLSRLADSRRQRWERNVGRDFVAEVDELLADLRANPASSEEVPADRVDLLCETHSLSIFERRAIVAAAAPAIDSRVATAYRCLDASAERATLTVALLFELADLPLWDGTARACVDPTSHLVTHGLLELTDEPLLHERSITVPDRVLQHLLGVDDVADELATCIAEPIAVEHPDGARVARLLETGEWFVHTRGDPGTCLAVSCAALDSLDVEALIVDLRRAGDTPAERVVALARSEAALTRRALVVGPLTTDTPAARRAIDLCATAVVPVIVHSPSAWDPASAPAAAATIEVEPLGVDQRRAVWTTAFADEEIDLDPDQAAAVFHLSPHEIVASVRHAVTQAIADDREPDEAMIASGARSQNSVALEQLARRVTPTARLDDVVLTDSIRQQLCELIAWAGKRDTVREMLDQLRKGTKANGLTALFVGSSGTGKTLAAEVMAGELGLDLYVIDLSTVVSKYIGETEKNLDRVFVEAAGVNGVLFFDEADALFGKRSEVRDSKDRYANLEVAYLLQRMEQFDGVSVLASNLRANLDTAFTRRIDVIITFQAPDVAERRAIWDAHLPAAIERGDVDLDDLAARFALSGGEIANAARAAVRRTIADDGDTLTMETLVRAVAREYEKLGRLVRPDDFGPWAEVLGR